MASKRAQRRKRERPIALARVCECAKYCYPTIRAAELGVIRARLAGQRQKLGVYFCRRCNAHHLTRQFEGKKLVINQYA